MRKKHIVGTDLCQWTGTISHEVVMDKVAFMSAETLEDMFFKIKA